MTDPLSAKAIELINAKQLCPHCLSGALLQDPHAGCSLNLNCQICEHKFSFVSEGGLVVMAANTQGEEPAPHPNLFIWPAPVEELMKAANEADTGKAGVGLDVDKDGHLLVCIRESDGREFEMKILDIVKGEPNHGKSVGPIIHGLSEVLTFLVLRECKKQATQN